jgi:hypothetical protein
MVKSGLITLFSIRMFKTMVEDIALTSNESYTVERAKIALDNFNKQLKEIHKNDCVYW